MRDLLIATGIPQGSGIIGNVGPFVSMRNAIEAIDGQVPFRRGDVNADGGANLTDAIASLQHLFSGAAEPSCMDASDIDDNGKLEISDAISLLNFLFNGGPSPPIPGFQFCGLDPTADDIICIVYSNC